MYDMEIIYGYHSCMDIGGAHVYKDINLFKVVKYVEILHIHLLYGSLLEM